MVIEIPPAGDAGSITGTIMDSWQAALEDVAPAGVDKGTGGKYLILPPGYKDTPPDGYIVLPSQTFQGFALLRSIVQSGSSAPTLRKQSTTANRSSFIRCRRMRAPRKLLLSI